MLDIGMPPTPRKRCPYDLLNNEATIFFFFTVHLPLLQWWFQSLGGVNALWNAEGDLQLLL